MSASSDSVTEKTLVTNETSENETESHNKENRVINETTVTPKRELDFYLETLKGLVREFQTECTGDQDLFKLVEDQEETLKNTTKVENRAAVLLQGARGSKDEVLRQGLKVIGDGDWQKFFHENKLGTTKNYGGLEIRRLETLTEWDDELSTLADQFLSIWESNTSLLPCSYARMLLNLRKKRIILEKRITTCVSIIRRLSKPPQKTSQMASFKLDELKIKLKKLELDWKRHQENEIEMLEQYRENRRKQKEKEEQRLKKELEKQERNAEKERQKLERRYRIQQREDKKRILQEQRERKKMETEAEQQSIHRQAAVLENFIKSVPKLSLFHGVNRRSVSISDELQQMTRENMKQEEINDIVQNLLVSIKHIRKKAWNSLGIKYVSFGQCYGNRVKLIQFEDSLRPPFHGVVPQKPSSTLPNGRNPFIRLGWLDYDYDSEIEWVESEPGESISESASEDDDSLMDIECNSSSDTDSFLIDDEHTSQSIHESGLEGCFPLQEELVGIVFCHEANEAQREILSKFPRKPISNIKIANDNNVGTSLKTSLDSHDNSENLSNDQAEQVLEMTENWRTLEDFWNVQEKYKEEGFQVPSSATASVNIKFDALSPSACQQSKILREFHQYLFALLQDDGTGCQNGDLTYLQKRFQFLFFPLTSLSVIHDMHSETLSMMVRTCLVYHEQQEWLMFMGSCLLCIMQTIQKNLESIHTAKLEELKTTKNLVTELLHLETFTVSIRTAFEALEDKIRDIITR